MGGLPWWLLKKKDVRLRESDPYFIERVALFEEAVAKQVKDLTIAKSMVNLIFSHLSFRKTHFFFMFSLLDLKNNYCIRFKIENEIEAVLPL